MQKEWHTATKPINIGEMPPWIRKLFACTVSGLTKILISGFQGFKTTNIKIRKNIKIPCTGEVIAVGEGVNPGVVGETVMALLSGGGYAEYATVHVRHTLSVPSGLTVQATVARWP